MVRAYTYASRGEPSKTLKRIDDYAVPALGDGEVRVRVKAVSLNPVDWKIMKYAPSLIHKRPCVAASDYSGTVVESKSKDFQAGDEVYGLVHVTLKIRRGLGSLAEEIIAPEETCAKKPASLEAPAAAGVALVGLTAMALATEGGVKKPRADTSKAHRVLVCGGASSVGLSLVPMLRHHGYDVVATCSAAKDELVRGRGAVQTFDYKRQDFIQQLSDYTEKNGQFEVILDCAEDFNVWNASATILKKDGTYINAGADLSAGILPALRRIVSYFLQPTWLGGVPRTHKRLGPIVKAEYMRELSRLVDAGVVTPVIDSEYPFDKTVPAFERLMKNQASGKVIIRVD